ncbi:MAG: single-stranded-DNA-specific exonuclease RecJ [Eubacteriales bacterium]|nr:single-stranded-DNA-specific exonuclease RecJ [Eubacteriales bacterium]
MKSKWFIYSKKADFKAVAAKFHIDQLTARILRNRDLCSDEEIELFLNGTLKELYSEELLPDIDKAAGLISAAVREKKHIRIVGDYDIDGVCSTYILLDGLSRAGANADYRIPDRIRDGYGINVNIVEEAFRDRAELLLTCDNGIAAVEALALAKDHGMTVIVTDHHNIRTDDNGNEVIPPADAVVDVKLGKSIYPTEEICGAVTAWKLLKKVYASLGLDENAWLDYLEFAAIATVGDIMTLTGENRIIVREGLKILNGQVHPADTVRMGTANIGLRTLLDALNISNKHIDTYHIGFVIGPCINAAGRLESADTALRLFTTKDEAEAAEISSHLIALNESRKSMTEEGVLDGIRIIEESYGSDNVLTVYLPELHESLAGIVAGRLKEKFYKPAIVVTKASDGLKGSGRSIEAYNMFEALCAAEKYLTKFGGHKQAAGLSLKETELDGFRDFLNENSGLKDTDFVKKVWIDAAMPFGYISFELIKEIEALAPFGSGFERPVFAAKNVSISGMRILGKNKNALKLRAVDEYGVGADAVMFGDAENLLRELSAAGKISILYYPVINEFGGRRSIQLEIKDYSI